MLKLATVPDLIDILRMTEDHYAVSVYQQFEYSASKWADTLLNWINDDSFLILLQTDDDKNVGVIIGTSNALPFSHDKIANEILWWVDPEYRSVQSHELREAYEYWAQLKSSKAVTVGATKTDNQKVLERYYRMKGFTPFEFNYMKVL